MPLREDAARLEAGNPSLLPLFVLDNALARTEALDPAAIERHAQALGAAPHRGLARAGPQGHHPRGAGGAGG